MSIKSSPLSLKENNTHLSQAPKVQFDTALLEPGAILIMQGQNSVIMLSQMILGVVLNESYHAAIVAGITDKTITLLECTHFDGEAGKKDNGVALRTYSAENFNCIFGKEMHVLKKTTLLPYLVSVVSDFSYNYTSLNSITKYANSHCIFAGLLPSSDTKNGRLATLYSRAARMLMTSEGEIRRSSICSELITEIVKIAEINQIIDTNVQELRLPDQNENEHQLALLEKENLVFNANSMHITPGTLEDRLIHEQGFSRKITSGVILPE